MTDFKSEKLRELLEDFYNLTGMKICILDKNGTEICYYPERLTRFCATLRTDDEQDCKCIECDRHAVEIATKTQRQYSYICHAGLLECVSPIVFSGQVVGFVVLGQIREDGGAEFSQLSMEFPGKLLGKLGKAFALADLCLFANDFCFQ